MAGAIAQLDINLLPENNRLERNWKLAEFKFMQQHCHDRGGLVRVFVNPLFRHLQHIAVFLGCLGWGDICSLDLAGKKNRTLKLRDPFLGISNSCRNALFYGRSPDLGMMLFGAVFSTILFSLGLQLFMSPAHLILEKI